MSFYAARQPIEDKDKKPQIVVVILETSKRLFTVCIELKEKGYAVVLDGGPHKQKWKCFFLF